MRCDEALGLHWEEREEWGEARAQCPVVGGGSRSRTRLLAQSGALTAPFEGLPGSSACPPPQMRSPEGQGTRSEPPCPPSASAELGMQSASGNIYR